MPAKTSRKDRSRLRRFKVAVIGRVPALPVAFGAVTVRARTIAEAKKNAPIAAAIRRADLGLTWEAV